MKLEQLIKLMDENQFVIIKEEKDFYIEMKDGYITLFRGRLYKIPPELLNREAFYFVSYYERENIYTDKVGIEIWLEEKK